MRRHRDLRRDRRVDVHQRRHEIERTRGLGRPAVTVEFVRRRRRDGGHPIPIPKRPRNRAQIDRDPRRLLVDAVHDERRDGAVPAVRVHDQEALESVRDEALHRLDVHLLYERGGQRDRPLEPHVIRGLSRQEDRSHEDVGPLRHELRLLDPVQVVRADRQVVAVLFQRGDRNQGHVAAREKVPHLRHGHVGQVVLHLLLRPQRVRLRVRLRDGPRGEGEQQESGQGSSHGICSRQGVTFRRR